MTWNATAIPKAISIARQEGIDVVLTTSPPGSVHLIGAAVKRATGAKWVADLRDSLALHAHRSSEGVGARAKQKARAGIAHLVARQADAIVTAAEAITVETRGLSPRGRVVTIPNGCDFDDFAGLTYTRGDRFRLTHAGSFFGKRDPKPFLQALAASGLDDVTVRFLGDFRPGDREFMESLGLADRVELIEHVPRRESLRLQRDSDALLLLIPEAGGRGRGVLSGKVFEYLAAERPCSRSSRPTARPRSSCATPAPAIVAAPEDVDGDPRRARRAARAVARGQARRHAALAGVARQAVARDARRGAGRAAGGARVSAVVGSRSRARSRARASRAAAARDALLRHVREGALEPRAATLGVADVLTVLFLLAFALTSRGPVPRTTAIVLAFFAAFLLVYLLGFFNIETKQGLDQFTKGMVKFVLHFLFLAASVSYLVQRGRRFYWRSLGWFTRRPRRELRVRRAAAPARRRPVTTSTRRCSRRSPAARARSTSTARSAARASTGRTR